MPNATTAAVVYNENKVLLTLRTVEPFKGTWCLPGGHINDYENAETAIIREVKEETGLLFTPTFFRYFDEIFPELGVHNCVLVFTGRGKGILQPSEAEVAETKWVTIEEALEFELAFGHEEVLKALQGAGST